MFSMEITRLIERCRQGDADALGELYKAYAQKMRGVCRRYVCDEQAVDDVLHDAFVIIFTSFDRLRDSRKAEAWMMSITRNVASKYMAHRKSLVFAPLENVEPLAAADEETSVKGVPLEEVIRLIDNLPEGYGQVFRLSVFEGMSHREIADMLGIEPHSSSSQLARAKRLLRKMMQQYWGAAALLLLLVPITFYLFRKGGNAVKNVKPVVAKQEDTQKDTPTQRPQEPPTAQRRRVGGGASGIQPTHRATIIATDSLPTLTAQATDTITADSLGWEVKGEKWEECPATNLSSHLPLLTSHPQKHTHRRQRWSVDLAYVGGFGEQNYSRPHRFTETPTIAITGNPEPPSPVDFENWSDYAAFLSEMPDDGSSHSRSVIMNIALNNAGDAQGTGTDKIVRKSHHYMPVSFSLSLKIMLNRRFALETGLSYSRLKSEFEMGSNGNTINEQQTIHYLGIPVKGTYNIYNGKAWSLYGSLGVTTEMPLYSPLSTSYYLHGLLEATDKTTIRAPWQWSLGTGLGLQYNVTPSIGLFAEPSLQYYIPTKSDIETYRTEHPFTFSLPLGIRFTW